jgi:acyl-CoA thioesterase FadM
MLLLFRFLITVLKSGFRSKTGPLDSSVVRFRALPHDCDLNFHLNAGRYLSFMDVARIELLGRMRVLRSVLGRGWRPIMGGVTVTYRRSVMPFERFSVTSRVMAWDEKWFYIEHLVHKNDGTLAATGIARVLLRGKSGNVQPLELLALLGFQGLLSPEIPR